MKRIITFLIITIFFLTGCIKSDEIIDTSDETCGLESSCVISQEKKIGNKVGNQIPNYTLTTLNGEEIELYDLIKGHNKTIISLEASWCSDCHRQDAKYNEIYNSLPEDVLVIPVYTSYSKKDDETKISNLENSQAYIKEKGYQFDAYYDVDDKLWNDFDAAGTPTNIVLDQEGVIKAISLEYDLDILLLDNTEEVEYPITLDQ